MECHIHWTTSRLPVQRLNLPSPPSNALDYSCIKHCRKCATLKCRTQVLHFAFFSTFCCWACSIGQQANGRGPCILIYSITNICTCLSQKPVVTHTFAKARAASERSACHGMQGKMPSLHTLVCSGRAGRAKALHQLCAKMLRHQSGNGEKHYARETKRTNIYIYTYIYIYQPGWNDIRVSSCIIYNRRNMYG